MTNQQPTQVKAFHCPNCGSKIGVAKFWKLWTYKSTVECSTCQIVLKQNTLQFAAFSTWRSVLAHLLSVAVAVCTKYFNLPLFAFVGLGVSGLMVSTLIFWFVYVKTLHFEAFEAVDKKATYQDMLKRSTSRPGFLLRLQQMTKDYSTSLFRAIATSYQKKQSTKVGEQ